MPHRLIHLFMPQSPQCQPKGDHGQVGFNYENMKLPSIEIVPRLGKRKSLNQKILEAIWDLQYLHVKMCCVPSNGDHLNRQMMMNPPTPWSFPKPSSLEAATCLCPVQTADCLGEKRTQCLCFPKKLGEIGWLDTMTRQQTMTSVCDHIGWGRFLVVLPSLSDTCCRADTHW